MHQLKLSVVLMFSLLTGVFAQAATVAEVTFSETLPATDSHPKLVLNGASVREIYLLLESYVGALYLEKPAHSAQEIFNDTTGHKRMVFHSLMRKVGARRIASALQEALVVNITKAEHEELTDEIALMLSFFEGKIHRGEETWFDYIPGQGTQVTVNGIIKGIIPGELFFRSMLAIWIGENPVSREFKDDILGLGQDIANH